MRRTRNIDWLAVLLFTIGVSGLLVVSREFWFTQDANWDLLNYHASVPDALLSGTWGSDFHPAGLHSYLTPYQDLLLFPFLHWVPAPVGSALILIIQLSIVLPLGMIAKVLISEITAAQAMGLGTISLGGAMFVTEAGGSMGDVTAAVPAIWAIALVLRTIAEHAPVTDRPWSIWLAALLFALAIVLKATLMYLLPAIIMFAGLFFARRRFRSGFILSLATPAIAIALYLPWGQALLNATGSPVFPMFNSVFQSQRWPMSDFRDGRFGASNLYEALMTPWAQGWRPGLVAEVFFRDLRWVVVFMVVLVVVLMMALRYLRKRISSRFVIGAPVVLVVFWIVSYLSWALLFGIQRYAALLEVLAIPALLGAAALLFPDKRVLPVVLVSTLAVGFALSTVPADFGRRDLSWEPIVPTIGIQALDPYDAIVIGQPPLSFLAAVIRDGSSTDPTWLSGSFTQADYDLARPVLHAATRVGIVFYKGGGKSASSVATSLGMNVTAQCAPFESPMPGNSSAAIKDDLIICELSNSVRERRSQIRDGVELVRSSAS